MDSTTIQRLAEVALTMQQDLTPDVVDLKELSRRLCLHPRTVLIKIAAGEIPLSPVAWSKHRKIFWRCDVDRFVGLRGVA